MVCERKCWVCSAKWGLPRLFPSRMGWDQEVQRELKCPASSSSGMCWQQAGPCLQE